MIGCVSRWTCPTCEREFDRTHQSDVCIPGCTVDECFAGRPAYQRELCDAIIAHLATLGPVHVDAVRVGVFLKHERKLAEVRPMARSLSVALVLPGSVDDPRLVRSTRISADRVVNFIKLTRVDAIDDRIRAWLTQAYDFAG